MRAAYIQEQGPPQVLQVGEVPTPQPGAGEVLVKIGAASINPIDTYIRGGSIPLPIEFPYIPGCDLAFKSKVYWYVLPVARCNSSRLANS